MRLSVAEVAMSDARILPWKCPKDNPKQDFGSFVAVNMASDGLAAAGSSTIVCPLEYAR